MKIVCAWCNKNMGEKEPLEDTDTTHGICFWCLLDMRRKIKRLEMKRVIFEAGKVPPPPHRWRN